MERYGRRLWGSMSIIAGTALVLEHIWTWGVFESLDFFGHEWLGVLLIIIGIAVNAQNTGLSREIVNLFNKFKK